MIPGVIVDDHPDVQAGLYRLKDPGKDIHGVADTAGVEITLRLTSRLEPGAQVTDMNLLQSIGLNVTCQRCAHEASTSI